jgi:hypothetical protein
MGSIPYCLSGTTNDSPLPIASVVDPDPHNFGNLDRIRIRIHIK